MSPDKRKKFMKITVPNYYVDYHMHSNNSSDAVSSVDEMCLAAIKNGIAEIAITDHFEPTPEDRAYSVYDQKKYFEEMLAARRKFGKQLEIKLGIELGQPQYYKKETENMLSKNSYDFILASAHKRSDGTDMSQVDYTKISTDEALEMYLDELNNLVDGFDDFDCLGHLDLVKRYSCQVYNENISLVQSRGKLETLLKKLIKKGKGIEINTSGLRQSSGETLPGFDVIKMYHELGGQILTVGSDAHRKEDLGKGIYEAYEIARAAGFEYITTFTNRQPEFIKIPDGVLTLGA